MDVLASDVILMATMSTRGVFGGEGAVRGGHSESYRVKSVGRKAVAAGPSGARGALRAVPFVWLMVHVCAIPPGRMMVAACST